MPVWDGPGSGERRTCRGLGSRPIAWARAGQVAAGWLAALVSWMLSQPQPTKHRANPQHSLAKADGDWPAETRLHRPVLCRNRSESKVSLRFDHGVAVGERTEKTTLNWSQNRELELKVEVETPSLLGGYVLFDHSRRANWVGRHSRQQPALSVNTGKARHDRSNGLDRSRPHLKPLNAWQIWEPSGVRVSTGISFFLSISLLRFCVIRFPVFLWTSGSAPFCSGHQIHD